MLYESLLFQHGDKLRFMLYESLLFQYGDKLRFMLYESLFQHGDKLRFLLYLSHRRRRSPVSPFDNFMPAVNRQPGFRPEDS